MQNTREQWCRREAGRQGYRLVKSRRNNPVAAGGRYMLVEPRTNVVVAGELDGPRALDLDAVREWLTAC